MTRTVLLTLVAVATVACGSEARDATSPDGRGVSTLSTVPPPAAASSTTTAPSATAAPSATTSEPSATVAREPVATPSTSMTASTAPTASDLCRRVTDFDADGGWAVVNDGVMGGRSVGAVDFDASVMTFEGDVVTAGGGFTSVRIPVANEELSGSGQLVLRVRPDDRVYGIRLADTTAAGRSRVSYGADFVLDERDAADEWVTAVVRYDELEPTVFGQPIDAPPFDPDDAVELGIIIADGRDGSFRLEVDWIDACADT